MTGKRFIGISRDHSISMRGIRNAALKDYNGTIASLKASTIITGSEVVISTIECGGDYSSSYVGIEHSNVPLANVQPLREYVTNGTGTPLRDSVAATIRTLQAAPGANDPEATFVVFVTTDGDENSSKHISTSELNKLMNSLTATDRWTFVFRVPKGAGRGLQRTLGIPSGNILEWDTTERGQEVATQATTQAFTNFMSGQTRSTTKFFANLEDVSIEEVKAQLTDISGAVQLFEVPNSEAGSQIRDFMEKRVGTLRKGTAFYKLVKTEPRVQDTKMIVIRDKKSGMVYAGDAARQMLALPTYGSVRLAPDELGDYEIFIQSTSVNRKVDTGSSIMHWADFGR